MPDATVLRDVQRCGEPVHVLGLLDVMRDFRTSGQDVTPVVDLLVDFELRRRTTNLLSGDIRIDGEPAPRGTRLRVWNLTTGRLETACRVDRSYGRYVVRVSHHDHDYRVFVNGRLTWPPHQANMCILYTVMETSRVSVPAGWTSIR